jgi:hypothetical protein
LNNNNPQEDIQWGYEDWSKTRHANLKTDPFGDVFESQEGVLLKDFSSYIGGSPLFESTPLSFSVPSFSNLELVSDFLGLGSVSVSLSLSPSLPLSLSLSKISHTISLLCHYQDTLHRGRILRSVSITRAVKRHIIENMMGTNDETVEKGITNIRRLVTQVRVGIRVRFRFDSYG